MSREIKRRGMLDFDSKFSIDILGSIRYSWPGLKLWCVKMICVLERMTLQANIMTHTDDTLRFLAIVSPEKTPRLLPSATEGILPPAFVLPDLLTQPSKQAFVNLLDITSDIHADTSCDSHSRTDRYGSSHALGGPRRLEGLLQPQEKEEQEECSPPVPTLRLPSHIVSPHTSKQRVSAGVLPRWPYH
jgi:hypothetical protein